MPDITMCENKKCPINETCFRYTAIPDRFQSYAKFEYNKSGCEYFWKKEEILENKLDIIIPT